MVHEPVNIHTLQSYITVSLLWDLDTQWCVKVSSACVCCYRCCYRWLVQARSPKFHRDKSLTVFSCDVVRWVGGGGGGVVWGFREGRCDVSSGLSQPGGKSC